jgi:predicted RNase H-like HicB family nuclease
MPELVFEVVQEADGGYCAECLTENIFTEGDTWEELRKNTIEATAAYFFDRPQPARIRLHLVRDEICVCQLDLAPFDTLIWPHLVFLHSSRFGPDGRSP